MKRVEDYNLLPAHVGDAVILSARDLLGADGVSNEIERECRHLGKPFKELVSAEYLLGARALCSKFFSSRRRKGSFAQGRRTVDHAVVSFHYSITAQIGAIQDPHGACLHGV